MGRAQLRELGLSAATVDRWVERGRLRTIHAGVYAYGHRQLRREGVYLAAVLACGPGAALSHRSAATLWGIDEYHSSWVHVTSPRRTGRRKNDIRIHRGDRLSEDEMIEVGGIPRTTVARTLIDVAPALSRRGLERAVEEAERERLLDVSAVAVLLGRHRRRAGVGRLRRALEVFDVDILRTRSELEARFFLLCRSSGLPRPLVNRRVAGLEVDFCWPGRRLIVETDGARYHDTTAARRRDPGRDRTLAAAGWRVVRCRWNDVAAPEALVLRLKELLAA